MAKRKLATLPEFIEDQVERFCKEPTYFTGESYHVFTHKGVEVQITLQRESFHKIKGPGLFDKGRLK